MTGWLRVHRMVSVRGWFILVLMFHALAWADDVEAPSLELLEFLAEGTEIDGQWLDPVRMSELTQQSTAGLDVESQGDE